jgi:hypothetical protein
MVTSGIGIRIIIRPWDSSTTPSPPANARSSSSRWTFYQRSYELALFDGAGLSQCIAAGLKVIELNPDRWLTYHHIVEAYENLGEFDTLLSLIFHVLSRCKDSA